MASLVLTFVITKKIFGTTFALVATLFTGVALSAQSRFVWNSHPATFFILLFFWLVYKLSESTKKTKEYFLGAAFVAGLIYGFQLAISVALLLSLFLFALLILKVRKIQSYFWGAIGFFLAYSPFFVFEARHGLMAMKSLFSFFANFFKFGNQSGFLSQFKPHLLVFWFNFRDTFYVGEHWHWWLFFVLSLCVIFYLRQKKADAKEKFVLFLLLSLPVTFVLFLFLDAPVWGHYLIHLHLAYIFLFAYFLVYSRLIWARWGLILFLFLMLPRFSQEVLKTRADFNDHGGVAKMAGKLETIDYIYQDAGEQKFNVLVFTPPVYDYAYRYLLAWYGAEKYGYVPGDKKEGLFYCWIEPEHGKPWTYQGWLETVIKTGEVLDEVKLPSGFIIQKRYVQK